MPTIATIMHELVNTALPIDIVIHNMNLLSAA